MSLTDDLIVDRSLGGPRQHGIAQSPNRLLAALLPEEYRRLEPHLRVARMEHKLELQRAGEKIRNVYFPGSGVCSVVTTMHDGRMVEVGTIGCEGVVNLAAYFAPEAVQEFSTVVQVPGDAVQIMPVEIFLAEMERRETLEKLMRRYAQAYSLFSMQATACNGLHRIEERCAKWLLMTQDRVRRDEFILTHEFFAAMLGVRRASVTLVARSFQQAGLISYTRGAMTITDRQGLKKASCECYELVARQFDDLLSFGAGALVGGREYGVVP